MRKERENPEALHTHTLIVLNNKKRRGDCDE